jgi:hypothetical protein
LGIETDHIAPKVSPLARLNPEDSRLLAIMPVSLDDVFRLLHEVVVEPTKHPDFTRVLGSQLN